jgi:hypothetical protein
MDRDIAELSRVCTLCIDLSKVPPLLNCEGVNKYLAPIGRTTLYQLATLGEIESASLGMGRGRRVFVTASIVGWLERRLAQTKRPNIAIRGKHRDKPGEKNADGRQS